MSRRAICAIIAVLAGLAPAQQLSPGGRLGVGSILVATARSHDPVLAKSVVLVIQTDGESAMGLILNRRVSAREYLGGPISIGTRALFPSTSKPPGAKHIFGDVWIASRGAPVKNARIYSGYTGWSAGQLSAEIARGLWTVRKGDAKVVFDAHPETLWERIRSVSRPRNKKTK